MFGYIRYHFRLNIPRAEMLRYYSGQAQVVQVRATEGLLLELPAYHLRPFITQSGISGNFELTLNSDNKFISLKQLN